MYRVLARIVINITYVRVVEIFLFFHTYDSRNHIISYVVSLFIQVVFAKARPFYFPFKSTSLSYEPLLCSACTTTTSWLLEDGVPLLLLLSLFILLPHCPLCARLLSREFSTLWAHSPFSVRSEQPAAFFFLS